MTEKTSSRESLISTMVNYGIKEEQAKIQIESVIQEAHSVIYIVTTQGGVGTIWDNPEDAIEEWSKLTDPSRNVVIRPVNGRCSTDESEKARNECWAMMAKREKGQKQ